jgi:glycosyltransferase involved in cell wall biosynthesis
MNKIIYLGMAARMTGDKCHDLVIKMINDNKDYIYKNNIKIMIDVNRTHYEELKKKVDDLKISSLVLFSGLLSESEMVKWYKKLTTYIHISKDETTSTSILQAMSMSLPVIASNIGGNKNLLKKIHNKNNIILCNNDINKIFINIKLVIFDKKKLKNMALLSRKTVEKFFSNDVMFKKYKKLF